MNWLCKAPATKSNISSVFAHLTARANGSRRDAAHGLKEKCKNPDIHGAGPGVERAPECLLQDIFPRNTCRSAEVASANRKT